MIICPECAGSLADLYAESCPSCGWVRGERQGVVSFLSKADQSDQLFGGYIENYDNIAAEDIADSIQPERLLRHQATRLINILLRHQGDISKSMVGDIGVGKGYVAEELNKRGADVYGVDITPQYMSKMMSDAFTPIVANAENLPFRDHFDLLVCADVMEHVFNPSSLIFCLNRSLKQGGLLFLRVPYRENIMSYTHHLGCKHRYVHLRNFNKELMRDTLLPAGFNILNIYLDGFHANQPSAFWQRSAMGRRVYGVLIDRLTRNLADPWDTAMLPSGIARLLMRPTEMTIVARKTTSFS